MGTLYEDDPAGWADAQAEALRRLASAHPELVEELDIDHLALELDEMKKSLAREFTSRLAVLLAHLAKWRWQPGRRSRSWANSIAEQRDQLALLLEESPSLRPQARLERAWSYARRKVQRETGLDAELFPETCLFTLEQALAEAWLPE